MTYAITLRFDEAGEARIAAWWRALADAGISDAMLRLGYAPHLTLALYDDLDAAAVARTLAGFAAGKAALVLRFSALGLFPRDHGTLWVGPVPGAELLELHRALHGELRIPAQAHYTVGRWVPHCTLAEPLPPERLARALAILQAGWQDFTAVAERLELVRFPPPAILAGAPLRRDT